MWKLSGGVQCKTVWPYACFTPKGYLKPHSYFQVVLYC